MLVSSLKSLRRVVVAATILAAVSISGAALAAKVAVMAAVVVLVIQVKSSDIQPFIYFQF